MMGRYKLLAVIIMLPLLASCARPVGDFGRVPRASATDDILVKTGLTRDPTTQIPPFGIIQTDDETEMHDRIFRFIEAPHTRYYIHRQDLTERDYWNYLRQTRFASSGVRYRTMVKDIGDDLNTVEQTFVAICRVIELDEQRRIALQSFTDADEAKILAVQRRLRENAESIERFEAALQMRYDGYSYALEQLLLESPDEQGWDVDAKLDDLQEWLYSAKAGQYCAPDPSYAAGAQGISRPSRIARGDYSHEPKIRK